MKAEPEWGTARYVPSSLVKDEQLLRPGDILVSTSNSAETVGRSCLISSVPEMATFGAFVTVARPDPGVFDPRFLAAWMRSGTYQAAIDRLKTRTTNISNLRSSDLGRLRVPVPPLDEQRRIAARLRSQLEAVAEFGPSIERRESMLAGLRRSVLAKTFERLLADQRLVGRLEDVVRQRNDIVHPSDKPSGAAVFVGLEHIERGSGRRIGQVSIDLAAMTGRKARFSPGNIVYGYLRPYLNKAWLADIAGFCSVDQYVLDVDARRADGEFVALFMLSDAYLSRAPITTTPGQLPRIRSSEVLAVPVPVPSLADQRRIAARLKEQLAEIDRAKAAIQAQRKAIDALPAALLREVFGLAGPAGQPHG